MRLSRKRLAAAAAIAVAAVVAAIGLARVGPRGQASALEPVPAPPKLVLAGASGGELQVVASSPLGPTAGDVRPSVTFDRPVVPLATPEELERLPAPASISPPVPGEWRWLGSSTVEFVPAAPLPAATAYTVTVSGGLAALDGARLPRDFTFDFETERAVVRAVSPRDGWRWVERRQTFSLVFSQPVQGLEGGVQLLANGRPVPVKVGGGTRVIEEEIAAASGSLRKHYESQRASDLRTRYDVTPREDLPPDAELKLALSDAVRAAAGPLPLAGTRSFGFHTFGRMAISAAQPCWRSEDECPNGPLVLLTTNPADARDLRKLLTVDPPVEIDWARAEGHPANEWEAEASPYLVVPGKFRPGTRYTLSLAAGLPDTFGQAAPGWRGELSTSDLPSEFDLGTTDASPIQLLEAEGDGALPLRSSNVEQLDLTCWKLTADTAAAVLAAKKLTPPPEPGESVAFRTEAGRNTVKTQPLPVRALLGGARSGLFFLRVSSPQVRRQERLYVGQLTDLAVHAKLGVGSGTVWVTRVSTGAPVDGAEVALHDASGAVAWRGTTDRDGLIRDAALGAFAGVRGDGWWDVGRVRRVVSASKDGDTGVTVASWEHGWPGSYELQTDASGGAPVDLGLLVAERGIYRPGEKVHLKGFVRYRARGEIRTPPAGTSVKLAVRTARDAVALEKTVALSRFGTFDAEVNLAEDAPLGAWSVSALATIEGGRVRLDGGFRVEAYRAPQFRVDVTAPAVHLAAGDPVGAQVMARYLFGAAMADAPVRWNVVRHTLDFRPPRHDGFTFGVETWLWNDDAPDASSDVFASGAGKTDALGAFAVQAGKADAAAGRTWGYVVEADVTDLSRQTVAGRAQLIVHPAALYAGVRRSDGFAEAGKPLAFELVAVTPGGERRDATVSVEVRRREWKFIKKKVAGERWATVSEPVEEPVGRCSATPGATSSSCSVVPEKPGFHVVEATVQDDRGRKAVTRTAVYVIGPGWVAWQRDETDRIDLVPDKATYQVGDVARILVKSPWPAAETLVSVEREGVLSARRVRLVGAASVLEVPIGEDAVPNVYVGLVATRGRVADQPPDASDDPGRPTVKTGYVQLKVERAGKRLAVEVRPAAAEVRPRGTVKLDLTVRTARGQGVPAEVTVWAVDESVLRLTGYELPDLVDAFHPPRGLAVRTGEPLLGLVMRKRFGEKGATPGGGGGGPDGAALRSLFRTTPLFAPAVLADAQGRAHVEFQVPDNLTTFRIMAVAVTESDLAGSGQSSVTVTQPLIALPALPRAARVGDRFEAGVVIHSPDVKVDQVEVAAEATGLRLDGPAAQQVALGGKPREVRFRFVAERAGEAVLRFRVRGGGAEDAVEQRFPVTQPVTLVATALHGETDGTARERLVVPRDARPDAGGLEVTLASSALGGFAEGMTQLVDYPYGCLEQLTSRLVPFVALGELRGQGFATKADWLLPPPEHPLPGGIVDPRPDEVVRKTVQAIETRQRPDGGYRFWEGDTCADPTASAYAVWTLGRAERAGFAVDRAALARGQAWLADTILAGRSVACQGRGAPASDSARVFALFALARTGAAKPSYHGELFERRQRLPLFARAMLADALARSGDARGATVLEEVLGAAKVTAAEVHLEEVPTENGFVPWGSDVRSTAMALQALIAIRPEHPFVSRMVTYLSRARRPDGRFRNTQEAAFALTALSDLVRVREAQPPEFTGRASLGGKAIAAQSFRGRSLEVTRFRVPMTALAAGVRGATLPLDFARDGKSGTLHYSALLRVAPSAQPAAAEEHGLYVQRWIEPWQGGGQIRATRAGEVLRLRVRVSTPQARSYVAVEVPLPSGLEAVDTSLATTARLPGDAADGDESDNGPDWWFWSPFNHVELRDDRAILFADALPPGLHTYSVAVRATTPGDFLLGAARGEEMYAPEVWGRSESGTFRVTTPEREERAAR